MKSCRAKPKSQFYKIELRRIYSEIYGIPPPLKRRLTNQVKYDKITIETDLNSSTSFSAEL